MEKYKDKNDLTEISPVFAVWRMCNWIYLILCFIGLISSQWIGFLALIVLSLIPKKWFTWRIIDNILGIGEVFLQLVSPGANEVMESYRDKCIDEVLDKIKDIAPDIAILEV